MLVTNRSANFVGIALHIRPHNLTFSLTDHYGPHRFADN